MTIHISIGNSDDKLSQAEWAVFCAQVDTAVRTVAQTVHGAWHSLPNAPWQNACWAVDLREHGGGWLKNHLSAFAREHGQDCIAWNESDTEFIEAQP